MKIIEKINKATGEDRLKLILSEKLKVERHPKELVRYCNLIDSSTGEEIKFTPYDYQYEALDVFEEDDYIMTMKTRQLGLTTISAFYAAWFLATKKNMSVNVLAQNKEKTKKFLKQVRWFLDSAKEKASWLIPDYDKDNDNKNSFTLTNNSTIIAESNTQDACRGDTINLLIIDEVAFITWMEEIWAAAGLTVTKSMGKVIAISTPKGMTGWYFDQYTNAEEYGWRIIHSHWKQHPEYSIGMYQWISDESREDGGYIKFYDKKWVDLSIRQNAKKYKFPKNRYPFIKDGKLRSPWYDFESKRLGVHKTKSELDCSFSGSGKEVLDSDVIRSYQEFTNSSIRLNKPDISSGAFYNYKKYKEYNPSHKYILSGDASTGESEDFSAFTVTDVNSLEVVASFKDKVDSKTFAIVINRTGREYGNALVIIEYQYGLETLIKLRDKHRYSNIYYSAFEAKDIETKTKKTRIGFWQSEMTRKLGGDRLEEILSSMELTLYSPDIVNELYTWVWKKNGKRGHLKGKNDDLIMTLVMTFFYINYISVNTKEKQDITKKIFGRISHGKDESMPFTHQDIDFPNQREPVENDISYLLRKLNQQQKERRKNNNGRRTVMIMK